MGCGAAFVACNGIPSSPASQHCCCCLLQSILSLCGAGRTLEIGALHPPAQSGRALQQACSSCQSRPDRLWAAHAEVVPDPAAARGRAALMAGAAPSPGAPRHHSSACRQGSRASGGVLWAVSGQLVSPATTLQRLHSLPSIANSSSVSGLHAPALQCTASASGRDRAVSQMQSEDAAEPCTMMITRHPRWMIPD